jgi:hypothetical protein
MQSDAISIRAPSISVEPTLALAGGRSGRELARSLTWSPCLYPQFPASCPGSVIRSAVYSSRHSARSMRICQTMGFCKHGGEGYATYQTVVAFAREWYGIW